MAKCTGGQDVNGIISNHIVILVDLEKINDFSYIKIFYYFIDWKDVLYIYIQYFLKYIKQINIMGLSSDLKRRYNMSRSTNLKECKFYYIKYFTESNEILKDSC